MRPIEKRERPNPEDARHNLEMLRSEKFTQAMSEESMGMNAGENKVAINTFTDKKTGRIIEFSNEPTLPEEQYPPDTYEDVTFVVRVFDPDKKEFSRPIIESVRMDEDISNIASFNINRAVIEFNKDETPNDQEL